MKYNMNNKLSKSIIPATIILTLSGIICRLLGFYYRIFLNNHLGPSGIGLIQTVLPLITFGCALCINGYASAISKFTSADKNHYINWFRLGASTSIVFSCTFSLFLIINSDFFSSHLSVSSNTKYILIIMACILPFQAFHMCLSGLYFGFKKSIVPAFSQIIEQIVRILSVLIYCKITHSKLTIINIALGNVLGELFACIYCLICYMHLKKTFSYTNNDFNYKKGFRIINAYSIPLGTSLSLIHLLESCEAILVPIVLVEFGLSSEKSLALFGIITGISIPIIMFPQALTNSFSVMLLPKISSMDNQNSIESTIKNTVTICMHLGIFSTFLFMLYVGKLGSIIFNQPIVEKFIQILAWLCPFLYLKATLSSILNGLSKTKISSLFNICGGIIRIILLVGLVPKIGISGYMYSMRAGTVITALGMIFLLINKQKLHFNVSDNILMPISISIISCLIPKMLLNLICKKEAGTPIFLLLCSLIALIIYSVIFIKVYLPSDRSTHE